VSEVIWQTDASPRLVSDSARLRWVLLILPIQETVPRPRTKKRSLLCFGCDFSGWYSFGKIVKTVAARWLKCTKFDFVWGSTRDPAGGAYSAPLVPLAGFKGTYF